MTKLVIAIGFTLLLIVIIILLNKKHNYNCSDFSTYQEAVSIFKENPVDIYNLDKDNDKRPCEELL